MAGVTGLVWTRKYGGNRLPIFRRRYIFGLNRRYAGSPAATEKELHFTDAEKASGYAIDALRWAVEKGVLNGHGDGRLDPGGLATRAQAAQMLKNYIEDR